MRITELPEDLAPLVGERIHSLDPAGLVILLEPGDDDFFSLPKTMTLRRSQELVLTEMILLASLDRKGNSIFGLDEYQQRDRFDGVPRWGFGEYPGAERTYDLMTAPDNTRVVNESRTIVQYGPDRRGEVNGLHVSLSRGF